MVSATRRSSWAGPMRPRRRRPGRPRTLAASRVSAGVVWMVTRRRSRARHAGTAPEWTCDHSRGRRWRSSRAWPMSFFADVVEIRARRPARRTRTPRPAAALAARRGSVRPCHGTVNAAAEWIGLGRVEVCPAGGEVELTWRLSAFSRSREARIEASRPEAVRASASPASRSRQRVDHVFDYGGAHRAVEPSSTGWSRYVRSSSRTTRPSGRGVATRLVAPRPREAG